MAWCQLLLTRSLVLVGIPGNVPLAYPHFLLKVVGDNVLRFVGAHPMPTLVFAGEGLLHDRAVKDSMRPDAIATGAHDLNPFFPDFSLIWIDYPTATDLSTLVVGKSGLHAPPPPMLVPRDDGHGVDVPRLLVPGALQRLQPLHEQHMRSRVKHVATLPHVPTHVREHHKSHAQSRQNDVGIHLGSHTFPSSRRMVSFTLYRVSMLNPDFGGMNLKFVRRCVQSRHAVQKWYSCSFWSSRSDSVRCRMILFRNVRIGLPARMSSPVRRK